MGSASATVRHVPSDYPSIQAALDAVTDGDTVLVESGTYAEALRAPQPAFLLKGNTDVDSLRPVIDPTPLPGSDSLACLTVPPMGNREFVLEDFVFRNGAGMYPRGGPWWGAPGGIVVGRPFLTARHCLFDSVYWGISFLYTHGGHALLDQCEFRGSVSRAVNASEARLVAVDCEFSGHTDWAHVQCADSSVIERCRFSASPGQHHLLLFSGSDIRVENCVFGPADSCFDVLVDGDVRHLRFTENTFSGTRDSWMPLAYMGTYCANGLNIIRGNRYENNLSISQSLTGYMLGFVTVGDTFQTCTAFLVDSNTFASCDANAIACDSRPRIERNRFRDLGSLAGGAVSAWAAVCRENLFDSTGLAVEGRAPYTVDAQLNWWGDSTGPYHPSLNPEGRGDTVGNHVLFRPWYPDTSFLNLAEPVRPLPGHYELTAYPNPFNNTCRIRLVVPQAQIVRLALYDLLGRRVRELWAGALALDKELLIDGSGLASGLYFVRAESTVYRHQTFAITKLVLLK